MVICQGFGSLLQHQPDDESRAATSKFVVVGGRNQSNNVLRLSTVAHHKVKAGAELTVDHGHGGSAAPPPPPPTREPEWLRQYGHCVDGIVATGQAARPFGAGQVITTSPVVTISPSSSSSSSSLHTVLHDYLIPGHAADADNKWYFPYGPGMGFLQQQQRQDDETTPNVALQWLVGATPEESSSSLLLLQVVALKYVAMNEPLVWDGQVPVVDKQVSYVVSPATRK